MSHVVTIETQIKDLEALKAACVRLGWQFNENQPTYKWFGKWVDDSPVPTHLFTKQENALIAAMTKEHRQHYLTKRMGTCLHSITVPGCDYEIGVKGQPGNYKLAWDNWHQIEDTIGTGACKLVQAYAIEKTRLELHRNGYSCKESAKEDGTVILTAESYYAGYNQ